MYLIKMCGIKNENPNKKKKILTCYSKRSGQHKHKRQKKKNQINHKIHKNLEFLKMFSRNMIELK